MSAVPAAGSADRTFPWRAALAAIAVAMAAQIGGCSISLCAPRAGSRRDVGGMGVRVRVVGVRKVEAIPIAAPHAFGIIVPKLAGYGYQIHLDVEGRDGILVSASSTDPSTGRKLDGMPSEEVLGKVSEAVELASSPDGRHIAFRAGPGLAWKAFHLLPEGVPFDSRVSGSLGSGDAGSLGWASLGSPEEIARAHIRDDEAAAASGYSLLWKAVGQQPAGSGWTLVVLDAWPGAAPAHEILLHRVKDAPAGMEGKIVGKALGVIAKGDHADVGKAIEIVERSEDPEAASTMDDALLDRWDEPYFHGMLMGRLTKPTIVHPKIEPTKAWRERAVEKARSEIAAGGSITDAAELILAAGDDGDAAFALGALLERWPVSDGAHRLILANLGRAPDSFVDSLEKKAGEHASDPSSTMAKRAGEVMDAIAKLRGKKG